MLTGSEFIAQSERLHRRLSLREARALHEPLAPFRIRENFYFLHVPKAGGTSFDSFLTTFFTASELSPPELQIERPSHWSRQDHSAYRYRHGAFWFEEVRVQNPDAHFVTLLRDPVKRIFSHYWHLRSMPDLSDADPRWAAHRQRVREDAQSKSLEEWAATRPGQAGSYVRNLFVQMLGGDGPGRELKNAQWQSWLDRAKQNLERQFVFFGLLEEYERSKSLFCQTFGIPEHYARGVERENQTASKATREPPSAAAVEIIREDNRYDLELYEFARELFERRWNSLQQLPPDNWRKARTCRPSAAGHLEFGASLIRGSGLHREEPVAPNRSIRWTGQLPTAEFEVVAELPATGQLSITLLVPAAVSEHALRETQLTFDDHPLGALDFQLCGEQVQLTARLTLDAEVAESSIHTLVVAGPVTLPPTQLDGARDSRVLGIAIEAVHLNWEPWASSGLPLNELSAA